MRANSPKPRPSASSRLLELGAAEANQYLSKHQLYPLQIATPPVCGLALCVVIPARNEPDILDTLRAVWQCERPSRPVEVIVVVNASEADPTDVWAANERTVAQVEQWGRQHNEPGLCAYAIHFGALPRRHAGVGLARKLGMDEALARLRLGGAADGVIASLDADCGCDPSYLKSIERFFNTRPRAPGASIYFEHRVDAGQSPSAAAGIARYELFLRYYLQAQRYTGFPFAFHTVGSCMAVRCAAYARQGGMNRRQAGEDFYFLHKLIALGGFGEITDTVVRPSARTSDRTPFGTGAAMRAWASDEGSLALTYAPQGFVALRQLFGGLPSLFDLGERQTVDFIDTLPPALRDFLLDKGAVARLMEVRANCASAESFTKRFFRWFDALKVLQYARAASRHYPMVALEQAASSMLGWRGFTAAVRDVSGLLAAYRAVERGQGLQA